MMPVKKVKGRNRHITTDIPGLALSCEIQVFNVQDRDGAKRSAHKNQGKISYLTLSLLAIARKIIDQIYF